MPDTTLALPLDAAEIKAAILDKIQTTLDLDCYLSDGKAYPSFGGTITINIWLNGMMQKLEVKRELKIGDPVKAEDATETRVEAEFDENDGPDEVRMESGQAVPIAAKDEHGRDTVKRVKYARRRTGGQAK